MNFIEAVEGLKKKKAFKRKHWSKTQYLILDRYDNIRLFDYYDLEKYEISVEDVISNDWEECDKNIWFIVNKHHDYGLVNDKVYTYYGLAKEGTEEWDTYNIKQIYEKDLKDWTYYIDIQVNSDNESFSKKDIEEIKNLL